MEEIFNYLKLNKNIINLSYINDKFTITHYSDTSNNGIISVDKIYKCISHNYEEKDSCDEIVKNIQFPCDNTYLIKKNYSSWLKIDFYEDKQCFIQNINNNNLYIDRKNDVIYYNTHNGAQDMWNHFEFIDINNFSSSKSRNKL
jgi:hypothetical protein